MRKSARQPSLTQTACRPATPQVLPSMQSVRLNWRSSSTRPHPSNTHSRRWPRSDSQRKVSAKRAGAKQEMTMRNPINLRFIKPPGCESDVYRAPDGIDRRRRRRARQKNLADADLLHPRNVFFRNDAAGEDDDVFGAFIFQQPHDLGEQNVVRAGEDRQA